MDDIFDETGDDLTVARHDAKIIETTRFKDGFREGWESSEQNAFESGFIRGYSLISSLVYDYNYEKERLRLENPLNSLLRKEIQEFDNEFQSTVTQLKLPDELNEEQQNETIKRLRIQFDDILLKIKFELTSIKSV
ncbi:unnamed protein product [Rotaria magnacalcarata]|uniref:Uncharacterized protein n=1 Tax=Rotaria magnacalcarata TaxID=392030 RepID=A0A816LFL5_9BILA|nr:unnamed protein product [Rotaria magnacalcarata]CAF1390569.1 unnamed protein product [Rotaria magnacalcarata]CAF1934330.1 unnamed protein product [Rotaria magnacalcarata]CAF2124032.1 unnamed protein product [Rotaria magnacalcarata]CAF2269406.1 unnamed protein product [Rotaria magnacalcarata]